MWFQTPEYLRWSRLQLLKPEGRQRMIRLMGIRPGDRVLDVGCGSGELTRYLAQGVDAQFVGIDLEPELIRAAKEEACPNTEFYIQDALALSFADDSFDVVISHTFFTAVFHAERAMEQMRRVCKAGGRIASITADSITVLPHSPGVYPNAPWVEEFSMLRRKLDLAFRKEAQRSCVGVRPEDMPRFFARQGLCNVLVIPIEKFSSLSNMDEAERLQYLELEYASELSRLELLPEEDRQRYVQLLEARMRDLAADDSSWQWSGGTNLLIIAVNQKGKPCVKRKTETFQKRSGLHTQPMRAHVGAFATVIGTDPCGRTCYGVGATPEEAMAAVHKKHIAGIFARQEGTARTPQALLEENDVLKRCLKQLNGQLEDTQEAMLQEMVQWELIPEADVFTCSATGKQVWLPKWLTGWCFDRETCCAGATMAEARLESLLNLCARFALRQIVTRQLTPPILSRETWEAVEEVSEGVAVLRGWNISVTFFDASCGLELPVVGALAAGNGGAKLRISPGTTLQAALRRCMAALLEGCTAQQFFTLGARFSDEKPTPVQLHNVQTLGEGWLPLSLLGENPHWAPRDWNTSKIEPEAAYAALLAQLTALGWEIYERSGVVDGVPVHQIIVPGAGMNGIPGNQRLLEYRLRKLAKPILQNITGASDRELALAMKYAAFKQAWARENTYAYLAGLGEAPRLFDVVVDGRILLGLYHIHLGQLQEACGWLPDSDPRFLCLKALLRGEAPEALKMIWPAQAVEAAQAVLGRPLAVLTAK